MRTISPLIAFAFVFAALIPALSISAHATDPTSPLTDHTWIRLGGPPGGIGYDIRLNPQNPDVMYVTDSFAGIHRSVDSGLTWENFNQGIDVRVGMSGDAVPVFCVRVDPNDPNIIWIGLQNRRGIYRSDDGGLTWEKRTGGIIENEGLTIRGLAIEPGNSDVVYAAGEISSFAWAGHERPGRQFDLVKGVVYKSYNAGETWEAIWRGNNLARYVIIDPTDVSIIYISTGIFDREAADSDYSAGTARGEGILKSYNGGYTWEHINNGLENLYVNSLSMHPNDSNILLAGTGNHAYPEGGGVYLSIDAGATWELVEGEGDNIGAVDFAPSSPGIAYAAGDSAFYQSTDSGYQEWDKHVNEVMGWGWGPDGFAPGIPIDIQVDPRDPQRLFVNNYAGGNILSDDGGRSWVNASDGYSGANITGLAIDPSNPAIIYSNGKNGVFRSMNGGREWHGILPLELRGSAISGEVAAHPVSTAAVWMSTSEGDFLISRNQGASWERQIGLGSVLWDLHSDQPQYYFQGIFAIEFAPSNPQRGYAGFGFSSCIREAANAFCLNDAYQSFLITDNGGETWEEIISSISGFTVADIAVHPEDQDRVWIAAPGHGVYYSDGGGSSWERRSDGLDTNAVTDLEIDSSNPQRLYAATMGEGVYVSDDGGTSWRASHVGMDPNEPVADIEVDAVRPNVLYAGSARSGVYVSEDGGETWRLHNDGLTFRSVSVLELYPDGQTLYAGTNGGGVFRLSILSQEDLDGLGATPTALPTSVISPTQTSRPPATESAAAATSPEPISGSRNLCGGAIALPIFLVIMANRRRRRI